MWWVSSVADDAGLDLDIDAARACADRAVLHWPIEARSMKFVASRENSVFRVTAATGDAYALRIHRPGYHTLEELESEIAWTTALRAAGIGTPSPIATRSGDWYAAVEYGSSGDRRFVGMMEWIDGVGLDAAVRSGDHLAIHRELGSLMAVLHDHAARWTPPSNFTRHALDGDGLVGDVPWWGQYWSMPELSAADAAVILAARRWIASVLDDFGTGADRFGLIHADLLAENVLVRDGRPFVIDFDDAGFGWHLYDMASVLVARAWTPLFDDCRDAMVEGYRTVRPLPDEHLALLPVFVACRMLMQVGWVNSRVAATMTFGPEREMSRADLLGMRIDRAVRWCSSLIDG